MSPFNLARDSLVAHQPSRNWLRELSGASRRRFKVYSSQINYYRVWEVRWFVIAIMLMFAILQLPPPAGLTHDGLAVVAMTVAVTILFIAQPVPTPTIALLIIAGQVFLLGISSTQVARNLMTDSVLFIMGSLMLAVAIIKQRLDRRIAWLIFRLAGTHTFAVCSALALMCGLLASVIGEHTVAAMMLPVGLTIVTLTSPDQQRVGNLAKVILFSIMLGCTSAGIATASGGARNAIMIGYWKEFFFDPSNPETARYIVGYIEWILFAYPMFLLQLPFILIILYFTFTPEYKDLSRACARLRAQLFIDGPLGPAGWASIGLFLLTILGWVVLSESLGLGIVALGGAAAFLIFGLVRWEDINAGVNWGVVLIYAASIALGVEMKETGAAEWVGRLALSGLGQIGISHGPLLWLFLALMTAAFSIMMAAGAAVAVLGPVFLKVAVASGDDPLIVGFIVAIASSFTYLTVASTPASTIMYASGYLSVADFQRVGWRVIVVALIILLLLAQFYWPAIAPS